MTVWHGGKKNYHTTFKTSIIFMNLNLTTKIYTQKKYLCACLIFHTTISPSPFPFSFSFISLILPKTFLPRSWRLLFIQKKIPDSGSNVQYVITCIKNHIIIWLLGLTWIVLLSTNNFFNNYSFTIFLEVAFSLRLWR